MVKPEQFKALKTLTSTEEATLEYIMKGMRAKEIAKAVLRSHRTVEAVTASVRKKLGVKTNGELCLVVGEIQMLQKNADTKELVKAIDVSGDIKRAVNLFNLVLD